MQESTAKPAAGAEIAFGPGHAPVPVGQEPYLPFSSPAIFWRPRCVVDSPMLAQVPYLFWLMETLQPDSVVQVGLGDGLVYMTLCQSIERLGARGSMIGLAGADEAPLLPERFQRDHDAHYADFSVLARNEPSEAGALVSGNLDLLVLNAPIPEDQVATLTEEWLPSLSERAVILVCQPERVTRHGALRRSRITPPGRPSISGPMSAGRGQLDVILAGRDQPDRLTSLVPEIGDASTQIIARQVFSRLGEGLVDALRREGLARELRERDADRQRLSADIQQSRAEASALKAESEALQEAMTEANRRLAELETTSSAETARVVALRHENAALKSERNRLTGEVARLEEDAVKLRGALTAAKTARASADVKLKDLRAQKAADRTRHKAKIRALHDSRSWRITRPLRRLKRLLTRQRGG
ncbi:hypothetical protein GCM10011358_19760 [Sinisalibacter lacisalsi]|uniref:Uncharacterized protein n=2 Tax=Sinisalibacter lacisalsi TaxID=1526570 RepID=A0ABQ1QPL3_9RHOB|nr:hypothetical protein GCM10011358_19760 [Sinisalibacter lacisalsi]